MCNLVAVAIAEVSLVDNANGQMLAMIEFWSNYVKGFRLKKVLRIGNEILRPAGRQLGVC